MKTEQQQKSHKAFRWTKELAEPILCVLIAGGKMKAGEVKKIMSSHLGRPCPMSPRIKEKFQKFYPDLKIEEDGLCGGKTYKFTSPALKQKISTVVEDSQPIINESVAKHGYRRRFNRNDDSLLPSVICCILLGNNNRMNISSLLIALRVNTFFSYSLTRTELEKMAKEVNNFTITNDMVSFVNSNDLTLPSMVQELWYIPTAQTLTSLKEKGITLLSTDFGLDDVYQVEYIDSIQNKDDIIEAILSTRGLGVQPLVTGPRKDLWKHLFEVATQRLGWWRDPINHCPSTAAMSQELANLLIRKGERRLLKR